MAVVLISRFLTALSRTVVRVIGGMYIGVFTATAVAAVGAAGD